MAMRSYLQRLLVTGLLGLAGCSWPAQIASLAQKIDELNNTITILHAEKMSLRSKMEGLNASQANLEHDLVQLSSDMYCKNPDIKKFLAQCDQNACLEDDIVRSLKQMTNQTHKMLRVVIDPVTGFRFVSDKRQAEFIELKKLRQSKLHPSTRLLIVIAPSSSTDERPELENLAMKFRLHLMRLPPDLDIKPLSPKVLSCKKGSPALLKIFRALPQNKLDAAEQAFQGRALDALVFLVDC